MVFDFEAEGPEGVLGGGRLRSGVLLAWACVMGVVLLWCCFAALLSLHA
jgi:hypothetical protein